MVEDVSVGEVYRIAKSIEQKVTDLPNQFVGRREYEADQKGTNDRLLDLAADVKESKAELEAVKKEQVLLEKERQANASARRWNLFLLFLGPAAVIVVGIVFRGAPT